MKKKVVTLAIVASLGAIALTGCGKTPTIEDLFTNISEQNPSSFEGTMEMSAEAGAEFKNTNETFDEFADAMTSMYGVDLSDRIEIEADLSFTGEGERYENISHVITDGTMEISSNVDAIQELFSAGDFDNELSRESYNDIDDETEYFTEDDGDTWYYQDRESDDDHDEDVTDAIQGFVSFIAAYNEEADEPIEVVAEDDEFVVAGEFVIDNDFLSDLTDDEKDALDDMLSSVDAEVDDVLDFYEEYGDIAEISFPLSFEIRFIENDKQYSVSAFTIALEAEATCDKTYDELCEYMEDTSLQSLKDSGAEFDISLDVNASVNIDFTLSYEEIDEFEIPDDILDDAEEYDDSHYDGVYVNTDPIDTGDIDPIGGDDVDPYSDPYTTGTTMQNSDGTYTLYDYDGGEICFFDVPDGWYCEEDYSSDTLYFITNENYDSVIVTCAAPECAVDYYENGDDSAYVGTFTPDSDPSSEFDVFEEEYDIYVVMYSEEYRSLVFDFPSYVFDYEDVSDFMEAFCSK